MARRPAAAAAAAARAPASLPSVTTTKKQKVDASNALYLPSIVDLSCPLWDDNNTEEEEEEPLVSFPNRYLVRLITAFGDLPLDSDGNLLPVVICELICSYEKNRCVGIEQELFGDLFLNDSSRIRLHSDAWTGTLRGNDAMKDIVYFEALQRYRGDFAHVTLPMDQRMLLFGSREMCTRQRPLEMLYLLPQIGPKPWTQPNRDSRFGSWTGSYAKEAKALIRYAAETVDRAKPDLCVQIDAIENKGTSFMLVFSDANSFHWKLAVRVNLRAKRCTITYHSVMAGVNPRHVHFLTSCALSPLGFDMHMLSFRCTGHDLKHPDREGFSLHLKMPIRLHRNVFDAISAGSKRKR